MAGVPPVIGEAFTFYCALTSQADTDVFQTNPTLAAGDAQVSIDGGAFNNLTALPTVSPAGGEQVEAVLSTAEMNGDVITVLFSDVAGDEWQDLLIEMFTDTQQIGDIPTAAAIATAAATSVWAYGTRTLTQSATQVAAVVQGSDIAVNSYNTWTIAITGVGSIADRTELYFTVKQDLEDDADASSILQVSEGTGLLFIDGAAGVAGNASITVTDAAAGNFTVVVSASVTRIGAKTCRYGVKKITATTVVTMAEGSFSVDAPPARAIA